MNKEGWVCPLCLSVMAPWMNSCINSNSHSQQTVATIDTSDIMKPLEPDSASMHSFCGALGMHYGYPGKCSLVKGHSGPHLCSFMIYQTTNEEEKADEPVVLCGKTDKHREGKCRLVKGHSASHYYW